MTSMYSYHSSMVSPSSNCSRGVPTTDVTNCDDDDEPETDEEEVQDA